MTALEQTKHWLEQMVIGLNLCPFAKKPYQGGTIRFVTISSNDLQKITETVLKEFSFLQISNPQEIETSLLILENALPDFQEFWDYVGLMEQLLSDLKLEGIFQIASFHPKYQFEGTQESDLENYTNRSPFPILHILREESLSQALENYPNPVQIPQKNIATLQSLTHQEILKRYLT